MCTEPYFWKACALEKVQGLHEAHTFLTGTVSFLPPYATQSWHSGTSGVIVCFGTSKFQRCVFVELYLWKYLAPEKVQGFLRVNTQTFDPDKVFFRDNASLAFRVLLRLDGHMHSNGNFKHAENWKRKAIETEVQYPQALLFLGGTPGYRPVCEILGAWINRSNAARKDKQTAPSSE